MSFALFRLFFFSSPLEARKTSPKTNPPPFRSFSPSLSLSLSLPPGALNEYDEFFALSRREFVPPNFAELRHVLNIAQVHASAAAGLRLVTFDADGTLYADGAHMQHDNEMIALIVRLLQLGVDVAIVTAAGYPGDAARFEQRVHGLLAAFAARGLPRAVTDRFHIMGGECNYLLRAVPPPGFLPAPASASSSGAAAAPAAAASASTPAPAPAPYYYSEDEEGGGSEGEAAASSSSPEKSSSSRPTSPFSAGAAAFCRRLSSASRARPSSF